MDLFQLSVSFGLLLARFPNCLIASLTKSAPDRKFELGIARVSALAFMLLLLEAPESTRWPAAQSRDVLDAGSQIEGIHVSMRVDKMLSAESLFQGEYLFPIFLAVSMGAVHRIVNALPSGMFQAVATRSKTSSFVLIAETKAMPLVAAMTNCPRNEPINARPAPKEIAGISRAPLIA